MPANRVRKPVDRHAAVSGPLGDLLWDSTDAAVGLIDAHTRIVAVNAGFSALLGYSAAYAIGRRTADFLLEPLPPGSNERSGVIVRYRHKSGRSIPACRFSGKRSTIPPA